MASRAELTHLLFVLLAVRWRSQCTGSRTTRKLPCEASPVLFLYQELSVPDAETNHYHLFQFVTSALQADLFAHLSARQQLHFKIRAQAPFFRVQIVDSIG